MRMRPLVLLALCWVLNLTVSCAWFMGKTQNGKPDPNSPEAVVESVLNVIPGWGMLAAQGLHVLATGYAIAHSKQTRKKVNQQTVAGVKNLVAGAVKCATCGNQVSPPAPATPPAPPAAAS